MSLSTLMSSRRKELKLNINEAASKAGMHPSEWSRWESGRSRRKDGRSPEPGIAKAKQIADALDLPVETVMKAAGAAFSKPLIGLSSPAQRIVETIKDMPSDKQEMILSYARFIAEERKSYEIAS